MLYWKAITVMCKKWKKNPEKNDNAAVSKSIKVNNYMEMKMRDFYVLLLFYYR